jgi:hypothetical protein
LAGDPFSSCFLQAGIQGGHKALIGRKAYEAKPWVGKFRHAFRSAIRRSIVHDKQFEIAESLSEDIPNRRADVMPRIESRKEDTKKRRSHG